MQYIARYKSPLGDILLASDDAGLTGIWFEGQRYFALHLASDHIEKETDILMQAKKWLDIYFSGHEPDFNSLWENHDIWRDCPNHSFTKRHQKDVSKGCRWGSRAQ